MSKHLNRASKRPISGPQQAGTDAAGHAYQLRQISNGRAGWPAEICIKRSHLPSWDSQSVTEAPKQPKLTTTRKTATPRNPDPKSTAATKPAAGKPKKKAASSVKTAAVKHTTPELVVPTQSSTSPLEVTSDLLDRLPLQACVELTRRLLTSISSLPTRAARPRAVVKNVILFLVEYRSTP
jgi:hypothetical protein